MGNILSSKPAIKSPLTISSDTVIPLHRFDDTPINRKVIVEFTMRFDDVLDPNKLRLSLEKLLSRRDWRKLGARLRLPGDGKLEYHIPDSFSAKRPAFAYSHIEHNVEIARHPTGCRLPRATAKPAVLSDPEEFAPLLRRWGAPRRLADYLYTDAPQLSLHIVSFTDATIVSLSWPHTLLDAMGRRELLDAWIAVLEGRDDDVKPLYGVLQDPLESLGTDPQEPYVLAHRRLAPIQALIFAISYIWTTLFWSRGEDTRMVCVPATHVQSLHKGALDYLASQTDEDEKVKPFVSEGDVLSGWVTRLALRHLQHTEQTVSIMNAFGMRSVLAKDLLPQTHAYVGNAVAGVWAFVSMRDLFARPLGYVAAAVRRSIAEQGTRAQVEARAAVDLAAGKRGKSAMYGDPAMAPIMISNWSKAKFFDTDFSAAVVRPGADPEKRANKIGRPSYIQPNGLVNGMPTRNSFPIVGKDAAGNYWLSGTLQKGLWRQVQEEMNAEYYYLSGQFVKA
ncbi:lysR family regulatory protein [Daldinia childiae]|uniref:lysR family regulatory protein n=1 Tax=Daldinia childiae TaxID=326645 RepID=UPI001444E8CC|nr:lysR family regulatory protein [Daldinia childiae]KAF3057231.1 lysR family regulatory protein [Daldinia childiae]